MRNKLWRLTNAISYGFMLSMSKHLETAEAVIEFFGRSSLAEIVNVDPRAVSEAKGRSKLPSSWYPAVRDALAQKDASASDSAFAFKKIPTTEAQA